MLFKDRRSKKSNKYNGGKADDQVKIEPNSGSIAVTDNSVEQLAQDLKEQEALSSSISVEDSGETTPSKELMAENNDQTDKPIVDEEVRLVIESSDLDMSDAPIKDNDVNGEFVEVEVEEPVEPFGQEDDAEITVVNEVRLKKDKGENEDADRSVLSAFRVDGNDKRHRFGEYVHRKGLISRDALHAASLEQGVTGAKMGQILVANGFLSDKDRVDAIIETEHARIAQETVSRTPIPVDILRENNIFLAAEQSDKIYAATSKDERMAKHIVSQYYPDKTVEMVAYDASAMNTFISSMRKMSSIDDPNSSEEFMLDRIIYHALVGLVSDIHIYPRTQSYSLFYRKDGVNKLEYEGPLDEYQVLIAKIKDKSAMDLAERRKPQDGGFQMEYAGKMIDLRVATLPVEGGAEKCIIRLLDSDRVQPNLDELGITEVLNWRKGLRHQFGLCLVCGPTGSGKTTTLNASIREMDRFGKAIYTIEDPVEYRIPYVSQVAINKQVDLDFPNAIRAFMRADPDVMVVGEIRDAETAANAVRAAETGHLVLATLHTGSIIGAITRLKELGVPPHELQYLIRSIMVQTLVRKVCKKCDNQEPARTVCENCGGGGYDGRTIVSECEYFETPEEVRQITPEAGKTVKPKWITKEQDAVNKCNEGITSREELDRVFGPAVEKYFREGD